MTKLELEKIKPIVEQIVENKLIELLGDPEGMLTLHEDVRRRLKKSLLSTTHAVSVDKIAKRLDLAW